jgi:UDPglucose 6-dehydrogenase
VPVVVTDLATAELAKESANALLAARLSLANVLAELCESSGADVRDLVTILGLDHRIGPQYLQPGVGFGGSCLPKDLRALVSRGEELGVGESLRLFLEVDAVNQRQQTRIIDWAVALAGPEGRVAVLGAAFKGGSDDVRESPALAIASALHDRGVAITVFDPLALDPARAAMPHLAYADSIESGCDGADLVLLLTDSPEYALIDPVALRSVVARPMIIDGRMMLDPEKWSAAGWTIQAPGSRSQ